MKHLRTRIALACTSLCLGLFFFASVNPGSAQSADTTKKWNFLVEPYLMFPYMDGKAGI
jgi:hypothetical protein